LVQPGEGTSLEGLSDTGHTSGLTPLHIAAAAGRAGVVTCLLATGCDPNKRIRLGGTLEEAVAGALVSAANSGGVQGVGSGGGGSSGDSGSGSGGGGRIGVEHGLTPCPLLLPVGSPAALELRSGSGPLLAGATALHLAAAAGCVDTVRALMRSGHAVNVNARTEQGHTSLHVAAHFGHDGALTLGLGDTYPCCMPSWVACVCFSWFAQQQLPYKPHSTAGVAEVLACAPGVDLSACDGAGSTALHHAAAARTGARAVLDVLWPRMAGSQLDSRDAAGRAAHHLAAVAGDDLALGSLIVAGASVAAEDAAGMTPGHLAAFNGVPRLMKAATPCDAAGAQG
jgi:hypothetical protein